MTTALSAQPPLALPPLMAPLTRPSSSRDRLQSTANHLHPVVFVSSHDSSSLSCSCPPLEWGQNCRKRRRPCVSLGLAFSANGGAGGSHPMCATVAPLPLRLHAPLATLVVPMQTRVAAAAPRHASLGGVHELWIQHGGVRGGW